MNKSTKHRIVRTAIIGAGPAGVATAIQLHRQNHQTVLIEKDRIGGLVYQAYLIENYPGCYNGVTGSDFGKNLARHIHAHKAPFLRAEVLRLDWVEGHFALDTLNELIEAERVVLATGTKPKKLTSVAVDPDCGSKIQYHIDGARGLRNKTIVIIGAGDAAFDYALNLARFNDVQILSRSARMACLNLLLKRASDNVRIQRRVNVQLHAIHNIESKLRLTFDENGHMRDLTCDHLIAAIGRTAENSLLESEMKDKWEDLVSRKKLFLVGDMKNGLFRQVAISVGDGIKAAMEIARECTGEQR